MKITVASGKGGTGKTTIAVNLALSVDNSMLIDCDVEGPNSHIFFKEPMVKLKDVSIPAPVFDLDKCDLCGKCAEFCQYNATANAPSSASTMQYPLLERSCSSSRNCATAAAAAR